MQIVRRNQIREIESKLSEDLGLPMLLLMNQAGESVSRRVQSRIDPIAGGKATVVCGKGHNGGDGLAAAWHLNSMNIPVSVFMSEDPEAVEGLPQLYVKLLNKTGVKIRNLLDAAVFSDFSVELQQCTVIVDALVGIGFRLPMQDFLSKIVGLINQSGKYVISVDIPSGVDCDTGEANIAVQADETVTFIVPKPGHFLFPGASFRGNVVIERLGIPDMLLEPYAQIAAAEIIEMSKMWRPRALDTHKGEQGKLLIIAGSNDYPGAAVLAAKGAARSGVGLIYLASLGRTCRYPLPPEVIPIPEEEENETDPSKRSIGLRILKWIGDAEGFDAVLIGPGLSRQPEVMESIRDAVIQIKKPVILDADALNAFVGYAEMLGRVQQPLIITPHPGEMARLANRSVESIQNNRIGIAEQYADEWNCTVVLKGAGTVTASPDGKIFINSTGNPGMATGGSGDVLAGLIGGLLSQGYEAEKAAVLGAFIHGAAGDRTARLVAPVGYTPSELADSIPDALKDLEEARNGRKMWNHC